MASRILFVFEGEKTEKQITNNLTNYFVNENTNVQCAFCADIYQLHGKISEDEDLDTFALLKERPQNAVALSPFTRDEFAEIYMFFDYDGHATNAGDDKILELLSFFNEETSSGKLFISYPMVEAVKHLSENIDFKELKVKAKENIRYKNIVATESSPYLRNITGYSKAIWVMLIEIHLKKMNYITNDSYSFPTNNSSQEYIFQKQLEKYIHVDSTVGVLSSFPIFLFDYYGYEYMLELIS